MKTSKYTLTKDESTSTKYVVSTSTDYFPEFISTSSSGERPLYIYSDKYGKPHIKPNLKLVSKKGHVSTLFSENLEVENFEIYTGDVRAKNDLIVLAAQVDFKVCQLFILENAKKIKRQIVEQVKENGLESL